MIQSLIGQKKLHSQRFLADGRRIPVTEIVMPGNPIIAVRSMDTHGYNAVQLGFGIKKHPHKALVGHIKGANIQDAPRFLREVKTASDADLPKLGEVVKASDVFKPGDLVDVIGISKGKGFAGGVKRYHFKGGPRTHGQSDRERAPGSIGQTTTPGRVYKGKRMAGHMGEVRVTVKNLQVVSVTDTGLFIKGLVPGGKNTLIMVKKVGEGKKFTPLYEEEKNAVEVETKKEIVEQVEKEPEPMSKTGEENTKKEENGE
ncbi:MAG: 50S ribosomal protein L3 [Candidatus Levybacteria bacterium]|nr:50S ribosomal protein L3 [Candidatus Levybacteria bacterium]